MRYGGASILMNLVFVFIAIFISYRYINKYLYNIKRTLLVGLGSILILYYIFCFYDGILGYKELTLLSFIIGLIVGLKIKYKKKNSYYS